MLLPAHGNPAERPKRLDWTDPAEAGRTKKARKCLRSKVIIVEVFSKLLLMWLFHCDNQKIVGLINIEMFQTIIIKVFHCDDLKKGSKAQS